MTDADLWHQENTRHLAAAVAAVRQMLERRGGAQSPPSGPAPPQTREGLLRWFGQGKDARVTPEVFLLPDESLDQAGGAAAGSPPADMPPPALIALRRKLGLSEFELDIVVLCAAMELDTSIAALCARAQGEPARPYPTFALALSLFRSAAWEALSPERPLRHWRLIDLGQHVGQPLTVSALRIDEWVLNYLKGLDYLDDRLAPLMSPIAPPPMSSLPPSQHKAAEEVLRRLRGASEQARPPVVQLAGVDDVSKQRVCALVCRLLGADAWRLPWNAVPTAPSELDTFARLWRRQSLLSPVALYLDLQGAEAEGSQNAHLAAVARLLAQLDGLVFIGSREPWAGLSGPAFTVDVAKPLPIEQKAAWLAAIGTPGTDAAPMLAAQFNLNVDEIGEIARAALEEPDATAPLDERLWDVCLSVTRPRLDTLAQRIEPKVTWDDIVLPAAESNLLHQIADQVGKRAQVYQDWGFDKKTARGLGINALFAGESGTGKTMAAEVIASHLRLNLYRIDLSAVVSKYIGETEKNLRRLFDAAEDGGAMLFFDEADALFGKRSEVKDSHDRFANIEINYLLQRMESFGGLAILATNQKSALDPAFMRRLRFIVNFPFPGQAERKAIWEKVFPAETPVSELDYDRLAKLNLTGGHIALIALNAAFVAANKGSAVTMPVVLDAARIEYRKLERPIHEADFRWPPAPMRIA
ncbi:MAG: ATP-binding protein [Alphaproteobacteria bacterium]|nr:ATP-binding protein [Alphaproteobacteria bacterium]